MELERKYTKARDDRSGAQIHDDLLAYAYCFSNNWDFQGSCGPDYFEQHYTLCKYFKLPLPSKCYDKLGKKLCEKKIYRKLDANLFTELFLQKIRSNIIFNIPLHNKTYNVVIHIRRGDVKPKKGKKKRKKNYKMRYLYNSYYEKIINEIQKHKGNYKVNITISGLPSKKVVLVPLTTSAMSVESDPIIDDAYPAI